MLLSELKRVDPIVVKDDRIYFDDEVIGTFDTNLMQGSLDGLIRDWLSSYSIDSIMPYGSKSDKQDEETIRRVAKEVGMPKKFNFYFVMNFKILPKFKGQMFGSLAMQSFLKSTKKPAVVMLHASAMDKGKQPELLKFYKSHGFTMFKLSGGDYGIQVIK
jgi:hypothetical protein